MQNALGDASFISSLLNYEMFMIAHILYKIFACNKCLFLFHCFIAHNYTCMTYKCLRQIIHKKKERVSKPACVCAIFWDALKKQWKPVVG